MTEPVRNYLLTPKPLGGQLCAGVVAVAIGLLSPTPVHAAPPPADAAPEGDQGDAPDAPAEVPDEAAVRAALGDGDLTTARELAVARSEADPSPENLVLEAEVWTALGDYENAKRAYAEALEALGEGEDDRRALIEGELEELEAASRGTKAEEPESEHREHLDRERAERLAALVPKPPPPPEIVDEPKREPIIKKWYFWVTLGAIVASAGAIVGIAVSSAVEDQNNASADAAARRPIPLGGVMFRF
jgi:hypothetical protein